MREHGWDHWGGREDGEKGLILQVGAKVGCGSSLPQMKVVRGALSRENVTSTNSQW